MQKPKRFALCFAILTAVFTAYLLLDTFVIERDYSLSNASPAATAVSDSETTAARASTLSSTLSAPETVLALPADAEKIGSAVTDSYEIDLYTFRVNNTQIYAADLKLSSVQELKTAFAEGRAGVISPILPPPSPRRAARCWLSTATSTARGKRGS